MPLFKRSDNDNKDESSNAKAEPLMASTNPDTDNDAWPNLLDESRDMLEAAILMYAFADLRALARQDGKLASEQDAETLLQLPLQVQPAMSVVQRNMEALQKMLGDRDVDFYLSSLERMQQSTQSLSVHVEDAGGGAGDLESGGGAAAGAEEAGAEAVFFQSSQLVVFDDEQQHKELVYGIAINHARRRITVAFRGSVTLKDWATDSKALLTWTPDPSGSSKSDQMGVHHGFHEYLLENSDKDNRSKCDEILQHLQDLLQQNPGYKVYCTGHSLGGALATLFAVHAAASESVWAGSNHHAVTCISIASPKVGNMSFRSAAQSLEKEGKLRCLRIANYKDIVTLNPDRGSLSCLYIACCQGNVYRHVGLELKLYSPERFKITRARPTAGYCSTFCTDWMRQVKTVFSFILSLPCAILCCCCRTVRLAKNHSCVEYLDRLVGAKNKSELQSMHLNELYKTVRHQE